MISSRILIIYLVAHLF